MAAVTNRGRQLRDELNKALGSELGGPYIPFAMLPECSLLARRAARHSRMQEDHCNGACGPKFERAEERLESSIIELAHTLPGVKGVKFTGDPRGYTVRLILENGAHNTWGGSDDGFGIA